MPANDTYSWNQKTLNIVFALSSVVMLLSVILMMQKDQDDEWRPIQRKNFELEAKLREVELTAIESEDFKAKKADLQKQIDAAAVALEKTKTEEKNSELFSLLDTQQREVDRLSEVLKSLNGLRPADRSGISTLHSGDPLLAAVYQVKRTAPRFFLQSLSSPERQQQHRSFSGDRLSST